MSSQKCVSEILPHCNPALKFQSVHTEVFLKVIASWETFFESTAVEVGVTYLLQTSFGMESIILILHLICLIAILESNRILRG